MTAATPPASRLDAGGERFAVGIDVGTSAVKTSVLSSSGRITTFTSPEYDTAAVEPGYAEQDPEDWWRAVGATFDQLVEAHPALTAATATVGLTGQMHTSVLRDVDGQLLRPAILWSDTRAADECRLLAAASDEWLPRTGHLPIPAFTSAHVSWVRRHEPQVFARIASVAVPKDDVRQRLGAGWMTEPSDASAMNLMDFTTDAWAQPLLDLVGIGSHTLPAIVPSERFTGAIRHLPPMTHWGGHLLGTPVIAGAGDQAAQAIALGVVDDGRLGMSVGTSGVAFQATGRPKSGAFRHAVPGSWLALDSTHAAGLALEWWTRLTGMGYQDFAVPAADGAPPVFLPFLQGGRTHTGAPGTLTDLRASHGPGEIAAAVVEGVAMEMVRLADRVSASAIPPQVVGVGGRAAQIPALQTLLAAGLGRSVRSSSRGSAYGAAVLAARSAGWFDEVEHSGPCPAPVDPDPELAVRLAHRMARFTQLAEQLR